jgi:hypothetical protein
MRALLLAAPLIASVAFLAAAGGGEGEEASLTPSPPSQDGRASPDSGLPMDFETIDIGQHSGIAGQQPQVLKIDTQAEWEEFWSRHQADVTPAPPLPKVDFSQEMVIAAVDQQESSGGYRFEITNVVPDPDSVVVLVDKAVPGADCVVTAEITQPFHIVRTAKTSLMPELVMSEETYSCE